MVRTARAARAPIALLVLDVDRLKSLNDEFGHLAGAEAVRTVGRTIGRRIPAGAVACRYGGDEFVIAIPQCTSFLAHEIAADLCRAVYALAPTLAGHWFPSGALSISVGVSSATLDSDRSARTSPSRDVEAGEALFRDADAALYRAKAGGRNQVCVVA
jgi:diguanylate cyclase (GGDEF)-like protein